jgi:hypothetical protein
MVMNPDEELPDEYHRMETHWRDPATPTFASKADAVVKLYANGTGIVPLRQARIDLGYTLSQIDRMEQWDSEQNPFNAMSPTLVTGYDTAV